MKKKWTGDLLKELEKDYLSYTPPNIMEEKYKMKWDTLQGTANKYGFRRKLPSTNSSYKLSISKADIIKKYLNGLSCPEIAKECGCNPSYINAVIKKSGTERRKAGEVNRKYKINESYFNEIDNEEKAYFLGFLFSDGDNNTRKHVVRLRLQEKDLDILERLNSLIENESPVRVIPYREKSTAFKNGQDVACLIINSRRVSDRLNEIGFTPKKSFTINYPAIPRELDRHFIRGYFDGNGSFGITNSKCNGYTQIRFYLDIDGSDNILSVMQVILVQEMDLSITKRSVRAENTDGKVVTLRYSGEQALKIMDWIYKDSSIKMDRKYQKYLCAIR